MLTRNFVFALLFVSALSPFNLPAQDDPCARRTIAAGVVDRQWNLVQGLSAANFRGKVGRQDLQVLSAVLDESPRRIVVLLDASGSMTDPRGGGWKTEKTLSEYLIRFAPAKASITLLGFSRTILDAEGFDEDPPVILKNLSALVKVCEQPRKGLQRTALYDAIASARDLLKAPKLGDVICALTDAGDNVSQATPRRVEEELLRTGVRLFGLVIGVDLRIRGRAPEEDSGQFDSVVRATGGNELMLTIGGPSPTHPHLEVRTEAGSLGRALHRLCEQMGEYYRLELALAETVEKPTKWKLEVIDASGKPMRGVEVHYPEELMPCAKASP
jgi:hypothetical protein